MATDEFSVGLSEADQRVGIRKIEMVLGTCLDLRIRSSDRGTRKPTLSGVPLIVMHCSLFSKNACKPRTEGHYLHGILRGELTEIRPNDGGVLAVAESPGVGASTPVSLPLAHKLPV